MANINVNNISLKCGVHRPDCTYKTAKMIFQNIRTRLKWIVIMSKGEENSMAQNNLFLKISFLTFPYLCICLTYYFFQGCQAESTSTFFFCILLIHHFNRFPYLLTTFSKDVWLSQPKKIVLISRSFTTSPEFHTYLLLFPRMSG